MLESSREPQERPPRATTFPTVLNNRNRSRFGRAVRISPGKVKRLSAVSRLYVSTFSRDRAAFAPNFPLGTVAPASSFLRT